MKSTQNRYMERMSFIICTFLFLFTLLHSGVSRVYAKEAETMVHIDIQTKITVSDDMKEQTSTMPFVFALTGEDNAPLPESKEITIKGEGKGSFTISVDKEGTYKYQIQQMTKETKGWKLDSKKYDVTVYAKMDGQGKLVTWLVGTDHDSDKKVDTFSFENSYVKDSEKTNTPENPSNPGYKKPDSMPQTGDGTNFKIYAALIVVSGGLLALLAYRKRREDKKNTQYER